MGRNISIVLSLRDKFTPDIKEVAQIVTAILGLAMTAAAGGAMSLLKRTAEELDYSFAQNDKNNLSKALVDASQGIINSTKTPSYVNKVKTANDLRGKSKSERSPIINKISKDLNVLPKPSRDSTTVTPKETVTSLKSVTNSILANMPQLKAVERGVLSSILTYNTVSDVLSTTSNLQSIVPFGIGNLSLLRPMDFVANIPSRSQKAKEPHHATGISYASAEIARVGENGPEDVILPEGAKVVPNNKVLTNSNVNVTVNIQGNMVGNKGFLDSMCKQITQVLSEKMAVC